ncbi:MAG: SMC-Scp complex subunit ScpB [Bacteroidota bacterium]|nr:SMC-Scp complex subunit ScpB [Bacteroidota bacterium]
MEISNLIPHIESLVFASDKPLSSLEITDLINSAFGFMEEKISIDQAEAAIEGIVEKYSSEFYPFEVKQSGGGWQFLTKKEFHKTVAQLNGETFLKRLSGAALETLAIVAYKQPVTKGEIESIRGVSSDYAVQKLLEKELVVITGRNEKLPGHPLVYTTSKSFMDYFGINTPEDLPKIREVLAEQFVQPTAINHKDSQQSEALAVTDDGELIAAIEENESTSHNGLTDEEEKEISEWQEEVADERNIVSTENDSETLEDEIAKEEFISDEIFAAEDEIIEEEKIEEELFKEAIIDESSSDENISHLYGEDEITPTDDEVVNK